MKILEQVRYILFEIKNPIFFRLKYLLEKVLKLPILLLRNKFNFNINIPYLFLKDYIIENKNGTWLNKAKTDYDYAINPYVEKELEPYFISDKIFLDIGAHVGKWSVYVSRYNKTTYSFEPNPETFKYLTENVKLNNLYSKLFAFNKGVGESSGKLNFLIDENETSKSRIIEKGGIEVDIITIDDFLLSQKIIVDDIDLIKVDTEGFEFNVFKGMKNFLAKTKNVSIICEILDSQNDKQEIFDYLESFGFKYKKLETPADYIFYK